MHRDIRPPGINRPGVKALPFEGLLYSSYYYNTRGPVLLVAGSRVYEIDFPERKMTDFFDYAGSAPSARWSASLPITKPQDWLPWR